MPLYFFYVNVNIDCNLNTFLSGEAVADLDENEYDEEIPSTGLTDISRAVVVVVISVVLQHLLFGR